MSVLMPLMQRQLMQHKTQHIYVLQTVPEEIKMNLDLQLLNPNNENELVKNCDIQKEDFSSSGCIQGITKY